MIQTIIKNIMNTLTDKEKQIGKYILNFPKETSSYTSEELAKKVGVSQSSIIKFIKKLGYKGFIKFKIELNKEIALNNSDEKLYTEITVKDSLKEIGDKILYENVSSLTDTISAINYEVLEKVIDLLDSSRKILIIGSGMSSIVSKDLELKLIKLGKIAYHPENTQMQLMHLSTMEKGDTLIAISHTGETKEIIEVVTHAKNRALKIITLTTFSKNTLSLLGEYNLFTISRESMLRTAAISSRMAQMILIDLIFLGLMQRNFNEVKNYIETSREIVGWKNKKI